jgi:hypothetical protein
MTGRAHIIALTILLCALVLLSLRYHREVLYKVRSLVPVKSIINNSYDLIASRQADSNISHRKFLYVCRGNGGLGNELNQLILAFTYSVASRRQFLIDCKSWPYGVFHDVFNYQKGSRSSLPYKYLVANDSVNQQIKYVKVAHLNEPFSSFRQATKSVQTIEAKRPVAQYFWRSMTRNTSASVEKCLIKNLSHYIGVHVRRGDKLRTEAREVPLKKYIKKIEETILGEKLRPVFVASDDPSVLSKLRRLRAAWTFVSINNTNSYTLKSSGHYQSRFQSLPMEQRIHQTHLLLCEIQMLVDADYVFCTMSSNICRLVQTLRHQRPSTAISLDKEWKAK